MTKRRKKVIVAMSGGVDSSVAAFLLLEKGYQVEGAHMRLFDAQDKSSEQAARAVAKELGIKLRIFDLRKEFKKRVIACFLREFKAGRTPNPCVVCNHQIKFGLLLDKAVEMGGDYVATGHYVKKSKIKNQKSKVIYKLQVAKDKTKDQSYFLYNLTQEKLAKILFPLGSYKKSEIYKMAEKRRLPYKKGESMDICFVGNQGHREFLKNNLGFKKGKIMDANGKILGEHQGIWFYTIGQRADIGGPGPFFVAKIDAKKNAVVVSNKFRGEEFYKKELIVESVNWVAGIEPVRIATPARQPGGSHGGEQSVIGGPTHNASYSVAGGPKTLMKCRARIRYGHEATPAVVSSVKQKALNGRSYKVIFKNSQRAITPGQSVVFYKRNEVLGGGTIKIV